MYAELHCLSNFSFGLGASHAEELAARAAELGYAALAITDECSLAGIVRAHQAAREHGLKLIVGARFSLQDGPDFVLLAPDLPAYQQLSRLISIGRRAAPKGQYRLHRSDCTELDRCLALWRARPDAPPEHGHWLTQHCAQVWLAVSLLRGANDRGRLRQLTTLAHRAGLLCVAAGSVRMHTAERRSLLDVLDAVRLGTPVSECGRALAANAEAHLRSLDELRRLYPPELLSASLDIAQRCQFTLDQLHYQYPHELVPEGRTPTQWLRQLTESGITERWPAGISAELRAQIDTELKLIAELGYEAFFLTVHDVVRYARSRGILCQGRGSSANSAVCYALGITAVDPAQQHLLFERFLSRERAEPPDIDVDFEHQRREEVIQYIYTKYGRERAALAATVICYRARSALRDVGRALGYDADDIARASRSLAWWDRPEELAQRLQTQGFDPASPRLRQWIALANRLTGFPRHLSQHVGGFVISEQPLHQMVPVENAAMVDRTIIQWDKDDLEALGMLKVDVLALGMLSAIRRALDLVNRLRGSELSLASIPTEDPATYAMIQRAETVGVFQIESRAQQAMLPRLQPRTFYDLVIQVAIVRPGPITGGMVHPFLRRRSGKEAVDTPPSLSSVLDRTLGVPIFQEQVMEIAVRAAGFTPGEADQMRRSMAAWKRTGGLEKFRERLLGGMLANGHDPAFAEQVYQRILGFGEYGFPESHSASFALLAYASSWLKCHEPAAFICALLNSQPMGFYPPSMLVHEAQRMGVEVLPVEVCASDYACSLEPRGGAQPALRLGLLQVSGLAEATAQAIAAARRQGPFTSLGDLMHRGQATPRALDALARAGALESLSGHRHAARWQVAAQNLPLPLLVGAESGPQADDADALAAPSQASDILDDYRHLGLSLRGHPLALLRPELDRCRVRKAAELLTLADGQRVKVAGRVVFRQRPGSAKGVMFMTLEDESGTVNLIVSPQFLDHHRDVLLGTRIALAQGRLQRSDSIVHLSLQGIEDISAWLGALPAMSRDFH